MKAITIHTPWAWAILEGHKRVENRTWKTKHRGRLAIHAGASTASDAEAEALFRELGIDYPDDWTPYRGKLLGTVEMTGVIENGSPFFPSGGKTKYGPWWSGPYGFELESPKWLPSPQEMPGKLSIWNTPNPSG